MSVEDQKRRFQNSRLLEQSIARVWMSALSPIANVDQTWPDVATCVRSGRPGETPQKAFDNAIERKWSSHQRLGSTGLIGV